MSSSCAVTGKLRVGIIGAGWPGQQHARAVQAGKRAIVQACGEQNAERAAEFARTFAPKTVYADYADLLGDPEVDAVVICFRPSNHPHFPAALTALAAGKQCTSPKAADDE